MKLRSVIAEMLVALTADIEYLRHHGGARIKLRNGQLVNEIGGIFVYDFTTHPQQRISPDTEIEVHLISKVVSGKIVAYTETAVRVHLESYLGGRVADATLVVSNYQLLEMLRSRLEKMEHGDIKLGKLASKIFDTRDFILQTQRDYIPPYAGEKLLNSYQIDAVRAALASPASFIWGPPGTGKTQTIASIVEGYLSQKKSVLLLSHTNMATDEALYKTITQLGGHNEYYRQGKIVRFGDISLADLNDKFISLERITTKQGQSLYKKLRKLEREAKAVSQKITEGQTMLQLFDQVRAAEHSINTKRRTIITYENNVRKKNKELIRLRRTLMRYSASPLLRFLARGKIQGTEQHIAAAERYIAKHTTQIQKLNDKMRESEREKLEALSKTNASQKHAPAEGYKYYQDLLRRDKDQLKELQAELHELKRQLEKLKEGIISGAAIVATTLTKSYISKPILARDYDCVILDEASMAPLPAVLCASGLAKQHVVIVGDFLQLPPVVQYKADTVGSRKTQVVHDWLMRDVFAVAGIEDGVKNGENPQKIRQLREQYRMHESIAEIVNHIAYGRFGDAYSLKTATAETAHRWPDLFRADPGPGNHIAFYDTSADNSGAVRTKNGSYYNSYNALVCAALAAQASESGYTSIGIISAYRAQANLIQDILADTPKNKASIDADTVHRFQGSERQLIIIDITTSRPDSLYATTRNDTAVKLLNVAISRAQQKCLFVGDLQSIRQRHTSDSPILGIVELILSKQYPIYSAREILKDFQSKHTHKLLLPQQADDTEHKDNITTDTNISACPIHHRALVQRTGRYGDFLGCPLYPACTVTKNIPDTAPA